LAHFDRCCAKRPIGSLLSLIFNPRNGLRPSRAGRDISTRRAGREASRRTRRACWAEAPFYHGYPVPNGDSPTPAKRGRGTRRPRRRHHGGGEGSSAVRRVPLRPVRRRWWQPLLRGARVLRRRNAPSVAIALSIPTTGWWRAASNATGRSACAHLRGPRSSWNAAKKRDRE
jgi:hypothetical protein